MLLENYKLHFSDARITRELKKYIRVDEVEDDGGASLAGATGS
jgi:hypothetical protein